MVKTGNNEDKDKPVADLCVEFWKLARGARKAIKLLSEADGNRLSAQIKYSERQLEVSLKELGLRVIDFEGEDFRPGIAASADNASDFEDGAALVVTMTLEPAVVKDMRIIRAGRVVVGPNPSPEE